MNNNHGDTIEVVGYGSLISKESALETAPNLRNFQHGVVYGYKRIFNKVGVVFFRRGYVCENDIEISSCATRYDAEQSINVSVFQCSEEEFAKIYQREHRFRWVSVNVKTDSGIRVARMCTEYNDDDYRLNKCVLPSVYEELVGQYYGGRLWRDDILPNKRYLGFCLNAVASVSENMKENFLETSFLADGETNLRQFLEANQGYLEGVDTTYTYQKP